MLSRVYNCNIREKLRGLEGDMKIGLEATGHYGQNLKLAE